MKFMVCLVVAMFGTAAVAENDCSKGIQGPIVLAEWSAKLVETSYSSEMQPEILFSFESTLSKEIIAIEASISAFDPLNRFIVSMSLPDIPEFTENARIEIAGIYPGSKSMIAVARLPRDAVELIVCTTRVAYADGTTESF